MQPGLHTSQWLARFGSAKKKASRWLVWARFQLYRRRFSRPNTHFLAFLKIYKIHTPSHRSQFKNLAKSPVFWNLMKFFRFWRKLHEIWAFFVENYMNFFRNLSKFWKKRWEKWEKKPAASFFSWKYLEKSQRLAFFSEPNRASHWVACIPG